MKKTLLLTVLLLAAATTASAQFAGGKSNGAHSSATASTESWNRAFASYNNISVNFDVEGADDYSLNGVSVGYERGFSVSHNIPLFIKVSPQLTYAGGSEKGVKTTYMGVNVPVSAAYRWAVGKVSIEPYAGINFRVNIIGKQKIGDYKRDCFKKEDMGEDATWNRFQLGGQIGVGVNYNKLYAGIGYGFDFMELAKKTKLSTLSITIGYNF